MNQVGPWSSQSKNEIDSVPIQQRSQVTKNTEFQMLHKMCMQGWLRGCASRVVTKGHALRTASGLVSGYAVTILKFLITFEQ